MVLWSFAILSCQKQVFAAGICFLKVNNRNTKTRCEICSKLTIKAPKRRHWCRKLFECKKFRRQEFLSLLMLKVFNQYLR